MDGFTQEMQEKMHGILSDVIVESHSSSGLPNPSMFTSRIKRALGDDLEGMTTVVHVPAIVAINFRGEVITRQINLIGIDTNTYASVSDFSKFLLHPENQRMLSFQLHESGYAPDRSGFPESGWNYRRRVAENAKYADALRREIEMETERNKKLRDQIQRAPMSDNASPREIPLLPDKPPEFESQLAAVESNSVNPGSADGQTSPSNTAVANNGPSAKPTFDAQPTSEEELRASIFDPAVSQHEGIVLGIGVGSSRYRSADGAVEDIYFIRPGDDVTVTFPTAGSPPTAVNEKFTVVDFYESKMSDYDMTFAFMSLEKLQKWRGMVDPSSKIGAVSSIQLRLRKGADLNAARDQLRAAFPMDMAVQVSTWRDLQGPLLAAVQMETTILNILLFLIIAVAGFGILATFFMIVVEKTKDIGILKSLGAPGQGVATIFLGYGVLLGSGRSRGRWDPWAAVRGLHQRCRGPAGGRDRPRGV